jgi:hypothetical protein
MKKIFILIILLVTTVFTVSCSKNKDVFVINSNTYLNENSKFDLVTYSDKGGAPVGTIYTSYEEVLLSENFQNLNQQLIISEFNNGKLIIGVLFRKSSSDGKVRLLSYKIVDDRIIFIFSSQFDVEYGLSTHDDIYDYYLITVSNVNIKEVSIGIHNELSPKSGKSVYYR